METNLAAICLTSFCSVFVLLIILAGVIRLVVAVFPERPRSDDAAMLAAIHASVAVLFDGARVTRIEEMRHDSR